MGVMRLGLRLGAGGCSFTQAAAKRLYDASKESRCSPPLEIQFVPHDAVDDDVEGDHGGGEESDGAVKVLWRGRLLGALRYWSCRTAIEELFGVVQQFAAFVPHETGSAVTLVAQNADLPKPVVRGVVIEFVKIFDELLCDAERKMQLGGTRSSPIRFFMKRRTKSIGSATTEWKSMGSPLPPAANSASRATLSSRIDWMVRAMSGRLRLS